jgi:hypothetical protein
VAQHVAECHPEHHLVEDHTQRPYIALLCVLTPGQQLRCTVLDDT